MRNDESRYHNLKPRSSLGSGWNEIHCPLLLQNGKSEPKDARHHKEKLQEIGNRKGTSFTFMLRARVRATEEMGVADNFVHLPAVLLHLQSHQMSSLNELEKEER